MSNLEERLANLTPAKRKLLELQLAQRRNGTQPAPTIPRRVGDGPAPLSFGQQRQMFLQLLEPDNPAYNKFQVLHLHGVLNVDALQRALDGVVARHEVMRTTYESRDGEHVQVINPPQPVSLVRIDLRHLTGEDQQTELLRQIHAEIPRPFDLHRDLMIRGCLFSLAPAEHVFLLVLHHIASDRWSAGIFNRELAALYNAFHAGRPAPLTDLALQYADFATWQLSGFAHEVEQQLAFWRQQLAGAPPRLELPWDHPPSTRPSHHGASHILHLSPELTRRLKRLSQQEGTTLFMTLLAAFNVLLYRYSGETDIVLGAPVAGRSWPETEQLIGLFINTVVMRSTLAGSPTFRAHLQQVRRTVLDALAHQDVPFERVVEALQPQRMPGHTPLFNIMFDFLNTPALETNLTGLEVSRMRFSEESAIYDLSLLMNEEGGGLRAVFEYRTKLFTPATVAQMAHQFEILLAGVLDDPAQPIDALPLLTTAECKEILYDWNDTTCDYPQDARLHHLIEIQVARTPNATALVCGPERITYCELDARASELAATLRAAGVMAGSVVGISLPRGIDMIVGLFAILKAGAAFLPLDPSYPHARLEFMRKDSGAAITLIQAENGLRIQPKFHSNIRPSSNAAMDARRLYQNQAAPSDFDTGTGSLAVPKQNMLEQPTTSQDPESSIPNPSAYLIYTSGSTGRPKGVVVGHRSAVNFVSDAVRRYALGSGDRVLQFASLSFDTAIEEIFPTLAAGATLVLRPDVLTGSFSDFVQMVADEGVTVLDLPTAFWHAWVAELACGGSHVPEKVRLVIVGGERALHADYITWRNRVGSQVRWVNTYGPTEATVVALTYEPDEKLPSYTLPIGRPISNVRAYVLDVRQRPVPPGVPGELYLGGDCLALGYHNRPDLTEERFIHNFGLPILEPDSHDTNLNLQSNIEKQKMYRTGDRVRFLPDGNIEYLGRMDEQVKLRGYRIELGEIETTLRIHAAVMDAAVVARGEKSGELRLCAYIVGDRHDTDALRDYLRQRLPDYMIPADFVFLDALPLTPTGKIDQRALPAPDIHSGVSSSEDTAPAGALEEVLAGLWADVLDLETIGRHDNFFVLGGHSLLSIKLISRLADSLGVRVSLRDFFHAPTIAGMAASLAGGEHDGGVLERRAALILQLAQLSDEEAAQMLAQRQGATQS